MTSPVAPFDHNELTPTSPGAVTRAEFMALLRRVSHLERIPEVVNTHETRLDNHDERFGLIEATLQAIEADSLESTRWRKSIDAGLNQVISAVNNEALLSEDRNKELNAGLNRIIIAVETGKVAGGG